MGIPRLMSHLQPYAVPTVLGCKEENCREHPTLQNIIIDGPSLAFYIYHRILSHRTDSRNPIDIIPSYNEIGQTTLNFLDELRCHGMVMYEDSSACLYKPTVG